LNSREPSSALSTHVGLLISWLFNIWYWASSTFQFFYWHYGHLQKLAHRFILKDDWVVNSWWSFIEESTILWCLISFFPFFIICNHSFLRSILSHQRFKRILSLSIKSKVMLNYFWCEYLFNLFSFFSSLIRCESLCHILRCV